ncbi:nucleotidyltransferase domain-containing protein [Cellulomonas triticagri]|nr:nucleotidyltransferase domain-containing protein [Cellulomonas triticagri]
MDWRAPERVFGSGLDAVVLRALWTAGRPLTGEQVARVAHMGSVRGIRYALGRLVEFGIVTVETVGSASVYRLNTDHLTFPAVDAAFRALDPWTLLRDRLVDLVAVLHPGGGVTVAIFGSVARGDAGPDSDVDLLVVVPERDDRADNLRASVVEHVHRWTGRPVGVYLTTPALLAAARDQDDPIVASFADDAITLAGPDVARYLGKRAR